jgi:hypothetical protein
MEGQRLVGIIFVSLGILLTLITLNILPGSSVLFVFAIGFFYAYYKFGRNIGFLIPACIFLAISIFTILEELWHIGGIYFLLFLGLAFILIFVIHTSKLKAEEYSEKYWPLYPGLILSGLGLILIFQNKFAEYLNFLVPIILILIGVILLLRGK